MVNSRAARIRLASTPDAGVAISGKQAQRTGMASGPGAPFPLARAAISAAGISQSQPALPAGRTVCAVIVWESDPSLGTVGVGRVPTVPSPARRTGHLRPGGWDRTRDRARLPAWGRTGLHA